MRESDRAADEDARRFSILERLQLLNADADPAFDRLTRVAAAAIGAPVALLTFLGPDRQWVPSRIGWLPGSTTLAEAFCRCAVGKPELLEVPDAREDPRFSDTPLVVGPHAIRFYAGHPVMFEGLVLGTVCVLDRVPRVLDAAGRAVLADLAGMASDLLLQRHDRFLRVERESEAAGLDAALQRSAAMLTAAQRVARLGSWELQTDTGDALLSAEMLRLLGRPSGPLGFDDLLARLQFEDGRPFELTLSQPVRQELRLLQANGPSRWVRWVSRPLTRSSADGTPRATVVGTLQDITESKAAQRQLRAVEDRFRLLWTTTPDVVVMLSADNRIQFVNPAVRGLLGHEPEDLLHQDLSIIQPERLREAHQRGFQRYLQSGVRRIDWRATEALGLHRDGREIPIEISFSDMELDGERMFAACIRDISVRKQAELRQLELADQLREAQKMEAIGALAGGVAHDFNNVLAGILGNVAFALEDLDPQHAAVPYLQQIQKSGRRGRELVRQILSFARKQPQALQGCDLNALVEESVGLLRSTLPAGAQLHLQLAPSQIGIRADATQLAQVVMNLCSNASQALPGGAGEITVGTGESSLSGDAALRVQLPPGRYAYLWVQDSGHGMDAATLARIFEPFFTTKAANDGTGLGLAVVHGIVGAHGGGIAVDSAPGRGSRFNVYLPPSDAPVEHLAAAESSHPAVKVQGRGQRVLYVDDDEVMLTMVQCLLQRLGYEPMVVDTATAALEAVRAAPNAFDAVISDFNMPGLNGLQLAEQLAAIRPGLPVLISSGNVSERLGHDAGLLGVRALLHKQHMIDELAEALAAVLAEQPARPGARDLAQ